MANKNSVYVQSLVDFILDTKPYHSKLTEIVEEYRFSDEMTVHFDERLFSSVMTKAAWTYSHFADGVSSPAPTTLIHRLVSPQFRGMPLNSDANSRGAFKVGRDENTDLPLVPLAFDPKSIQGVGLADAFVQRGGIGTKNEALLEGHDVFLSHGAYVFSIKQTINAANQYLPLYTERRAEGVLAHATAVAQAQALNKSNPTSAISLIQVILTRIANQLALTPNATASAALATAQAIVTAGTTLPQTYEALINALKTANTPMIAGGWLNWDQVHSQLSAYTTSLFMNEYSDLAPRADGSGIGREAGALMYADVLDRTDVTITAITPNTNRPDYEEYTLIAVADDAFFVRGSVTGMIGQASVGAFGSPITFTSPQISFKVAKASSGAPALTLDDEITLTPKAKITIHESAPLETWSLIKINPMAYSRPVLFSTRYGYLIDSTAQQNMITVLDSAFPTGTVTIQATSSTSFTVTISAEPSYSAVATVGVPFNDGRLAFTIIAGSEYTFEVGDAFFIEIENETPIAEGLDLFYGFDMDPYDGDVYRYNTVNSAVQDYLRKLDFGWDSRFTSYDLTSFNLELAQTAVNNRQWRLRALPNTARPLPLQNSSPSNQVNLIASNDPTNPNAPAQYDMTNNVTSEGPQSATDPDLVTDLRLWYADSFALEYWDEGTSTWISVGTVPVGSTYTNSTHGLTFTLVPAAKPFIAARLTSSWYGSSGATYSEPFTDLSSFTVTSGNGALFTLVSTAHGPGMNIASQNTGTVARRVKNIGSITAETISAKFQVTASNSDDAAILVFSAAAEQVVINPRREGAFDAQRRAYVSVGTETIAVSPTGLTVGNWYQADITIAPGAGNTVVVLRDLSTNAIVQTTALVNSHNAPVVTAIRFDVDSGGATCATQYADIDLTAPLAVVSETVDGGDVIQWTVLNDPPIQNEPAGLTSPRAPRLIMHGDSYHDSIPAKWTLQFIGDGVYTVQGTYTTGDDNGSQILTTPITVTMSADGRSFRNDDLGLHWTVVTGSTGLGAGDSFAIETFERKPMFMVHGSVSGWQPDAALNEWYWNGKIGFKLHGPDVALYENNLRLNGSPWTTSAGVVTLEHVRADAPTAVYTIRSHNNGHWTLYRNGEVVGDGTSEVADKYVSVSLPTAVAGKIFTLQVIADDFALPLGHDLAIVRTSPGRAPVSGDFVLLSRTEQDNIQISIKAKDSAHSTVLSQLAPVTIDLRYVDHSANSGVPLSNTSPETAVLPGWIPALLTKFDSATSVAEFSDPATSVVVRAAATGEKIGTVESIGTTPVEPVIFRWDSAFAAKYLPLNAEATIVTLGSGMDDRVNVNMTEGIQFLLSGGGLNEDALFADSMTVHIDEDPQFKIKSTYEGSFTVNIEDGPFGGFLPGYDNLPFDFEDGVDGYFDAGQAFTAYFQQAKELAMKNVLTPQEQATFNDLMGLIGAYTNDPASMTLAQFITAINADPPVNYTPTSIGFGIPALGLGMQIEERPTGSASTNVIEAMTVRIVDFGNTYDQYGFDYGQMDTPPEEMMTVFSNDLPPLPTTGLPPNGTLYANFETPLFIPAPGGRVIDISFAAEVVVTPAFYVWRPTESAPRRVPVVEKITSRLFRFTVPAGSELKLVVV